MEEAQVELIRQRHEGIDAFLNANWSMLIGFVMELGSPDPAMVLKDAANYLSLVDRWAATQDLNDGNRFWFVSRMSAFIGEYIAQRFAGSWCVDETVSSESFGRYVIGQFLTADPRAMVDPFRVAVHLAELPPGRSLCSVMREVEQEIAALSA